MNSPRIRIALVDDHTMLREGLREILTTYQYEVVMEAQNGQDFLDQLKGVDNLPDLCLLDIDMPVMDGYTTARILREKYPSIRILAMTVFEERGKRKKILECGADGFLAKSSGPETWTQMIEKTYGEPRK